MLHAQCAFTGVNTKVTEGALWCVCRARLYKFGVFRLVACISVKFCSCFSNEDESLS